MRHTRIHNMRCKIAKFTEFWATHVVSLCDSEYLYITRSRQAMRDTLLFDQQKDIFSLHMRGSSLVSMCGFLYVCLCWSLRPLSSRLHDLAFFSLGECKAAMLITCSVSLFVREKTHVTQRKSRPVVRPLSPLRRRQQR